jgi:hypothetical protein
MGVIIIREMVGRSPNSWSDAARRAVAVLGQLGVDDLALALGSVRGPLLLAVEEHHEVGVLLDRARLAEVRQARLVLVAHLRLPAQLAQGDDRDAQLTGERLEPARDLRDLLDAVAVAVRRSRLHQLEVVDDHQVETRLRVQPTSLRPKLHRADARGVVDI